MYYWCQVNTFELQFELITWSVSALTNSFSSEKVLYCTISSPIWLPVVNPVGRSQGKVCGQGCFVPRVKLEQLTTTSIYPSRRSLWKHFEVCYVISFFCHISETHRQTIVYSYYFREHFATLRYSLTLPRCPSATTLLPQDFRTRQSLLLVRHCYHQKQALYFYAIELGDMAYKLFYTSRTLYRT